MPSNDASLESVKFKNYRSCKRTTLDLDARVTVLIGMNGAGKTNVMQGIKLLGKLQRRFERPRADDHYLQGSQIIGEFSTKDRPDKHIDLRVDFSLRQSKSDEEPRPRRIEKWRLGDVHTIPETWVPIIAEAHFPEISAPADKIALISSGKSATKSVRLGKKVVDALDAIDSLRNTIQYYSASQFTNPSACPTHFEVDEEDGTVSLYASNKSKHGAFIQRLYRMSADNESSYDEYLSVVGRDGIRLIDSIHWERISLANASYEVRSGGKIVNQNRKRTLIVPIVSAGGRELSFDQLSEGTFRTLATIFHVMNDRSSLLLLEEPEVCVHHGLLSSVIEIIKGCAEKKQIVISTHSEAVLDAFEPEQIRLVQYEDTEGTKVDRLSEAMSARSYGALKDYLQNIGNLGEYWRLSGFSK